MKPVAPLLFCIVLMLFSACSKDDSDPCDDKICFNGGVCIDGGCECPVGYSGSDCGTQVVPRSIQITKITVTKFPATEANGGGWDLTSGPDIFVYLTYNGNVLYNPSTFTQNASSSIQYEYIPDSPLLLENPQFQYSISLYDYDDFDADDFMGGINFIPFSIGNGFPSTVQLDGGGKVAFLLEYSYRF